MQIGPVPWSNVVTGLILSSSYSRNFGFLLLYFIVLFMLPTTDLPPGKCFLEKKQASLGHQENSELCIYIF